MFPHDVADPQSWNKYTYTRNNPLQYVDPDGEDWQSFKDKLVGAWTSTVNALRTSGNAVGLGYTAAGRALSENPGFSYSTISYTDLNNIGANITLMAAGGEFGIGAEAGTATGGTAAEVANDGTAGSTFQQGTFSISNWTGYPAGVPQPPGGTTFRLLEGTEYQANRSAANQANQAMRMADPAAYAGKEIHEISPVKFGGDPTDPGNKVALPKDVHRQQVNPWWNRLKKDVESIVGGGSN